MDCRIARHRDAITPGLFTSYSDCQGFPLAGKYEMGLFVKADVQGRGPLQASYKETATSTCPIRREFTIESVGDSPVALIGSELRFKTQWLGTLVSPGLTTRSEYEIRFLLNDLTEDRTKINMKLAEDSIKGKLKLIAVKGVPVPVLIPGWQKDEVEHEPYAVPIPLVAGHKYELLLKLRIPATSGYTGVYHPETSFSEFSYFTSGLEEDGFIRLSDIDIDAGLLP